MTGQHSLELSVFVLMWKTQQCNIIEVRVSDQHILLMESSLRSPSTSLLTA